MGLANALRRLVALLFLQTFGVTCYDLDIRVGHEFNVATWECSTNVPLTACHVALMDFSRSGQTVVLEVNEGPPVAVDDPESPVLMYEYTGLGLIDGVCGVRVTPRFEDDAMWMVGCRVNAESNGWKYAWGAYYKASVLWMGEDFKTEPRQVVALPGQEAVAVCRAQRALHTCWIGPPDLKSDFIFVEGQDYKQSNRHMYHGIGVSRGECGMEIEEVGEEHNGLVVCLSKASGLPEMYTWNVIPIIVADPPVSVTLQVVHVDGYVSATCTVDGGRPAADMTWLLGTEFLRRDDLLDEITDVWTWPWDVGTFSQTVRWLVLPEQDGVPLMCVVKHAALWHSVVLWEEVVFSDPPEIIINTKTVIIAEVNSTSSTESTTSTTTEFTTPTSTTTELTTPTSTTSKPTTSTPTSTTEGPHTDCCCFVKRCHSLFRNNNLQRFCTKTFTCSKIKICCPQL